MKKVQTQQYRLRGSPRVINETSVDEPNKTNNSQQLHQTTRIDPIAFRASSEECSIASNGYDCSQVKLDNEIPSSSSVSTTFNSQSSKDLSNNKYTTTSSTSSTSTSSNKATASIDPDIPPQFVTWDIRSLFECPVCLDYAIPPINQCQNGHIVCQTCRKKISNCPTCRIPIAEPIRNLQLDRLANSFQFPCKYNFNGCQWKSYCFAKHLHEDCCQYISYGCPCPGTPCKWTGLLKDVMQHLSTHHRSITTLQGEDIVFLATDINLKGAVDWVMIQSCYDNHFLLVLEKQEMKSGAQHFFAIVQFIGSPKEAENFRYKLELSSSNSEGKQTKKLQWEAAPKSTLEGIQGAISSYDCLVFDAKTAKHFLSPIHNNDPQHSDSASSLAISRAEGENLAINVTITQTKMTNED